MKKIIKILFVFLLFGMNFSFAFEFKNPFKKNEPQSKPKMVETQQEWEVEAQNIPLEERELKKQKPNED